MDTGKGTFEELKAAAGEVEAAKKQMEAKYPQHGGWFHVGQQVTVNGSRFRVKAVKPDEIRLKLLPRQETK